MNKELIFPNGPVVVGGIGGSGTRIIAKILQELNFFIGNDLNESLDNLSYTLLFKRPRWYLKHNTRQDLLERGLRVLEKSMISREPFTLAEHLYLLRAAADMYRNGQNNSHHGTGMWAIDRYRKILFLKHNNKRNFAGWGWKEPNSHLMLEYINIFFPGLKYIHTVRHGLDMAFSKNQQQLFNWGSLFGVDLPVSDNQIPGAAFQYWARANKAVLEKGKVLGPKKFFLLNYDQLCLKPKQIIPKLVEFLEIEIDEKILDHVLRLPHVPESTGRYHKYNISGFNEDDLAILKEIGYSI